MKSNNQIKQKKIREHGKTDEGKLIAIVNHLMENYHGITIKREPFFLFDGMTDKLVDKVGYCTEEQVKKYIVHPPDILIITPKEDFVIELDGTWHDTHARKDYARNRLYDYNKIQYFTINETELRFRLGLQKLFIEDILDEVDRKIKEKGWLDNFIIV